MTHSEEHEIYNAGWNAGRWLETSAIDFYKKSHGDRGEELYREGYLDGLVAGGHR